jgi:hypothetical protein
MPAFMAMVHHKTAAVEPPPTYRASPILAQKHIESSLVGDAVFGEAGPHHFRPVEVSSGARPWLRLTLGALSFDGRDLWRRVWVMSFIDGPRARVSLYFFLRPNSQRHGPSQKDPRS